MTIRSSAHRPMWRLMKTPPLVHWRFTVSDVETDAASLLVTASSSDQTLLPDGNIVLGGSGANRTVMLTPAADANGSAVVTLTVTDADSGTAQGSVHIDRERSE